MISAMPVVSSQPARFSGRTAAMVILALTAIRVAVLAVSDLNLHGDEAQYWSWSRDLAFGYVTKPPMIAWIIAATTSTCGDGEWCVRLASPLFHAATGAVIYMLGKDIYDAQTGFWASVTYATMPAVSYSSGIISTDVPLLFFWSVALYAFIRLSRTRHMGWAVLLGVSFGLGLLSKYAMIYFLICGAVYGAISAEARRVLFSRQVALALVIGALIAAPNVAWNVQNGWTTFTHTAENAKWSGPLFHPGKMLEFFGAQFGVFGPILFAGLLGWLAVQRPWRGSERERLLFAFAVPVLAIVIVQGLLSRAHANWAAVTYVAATVAVVAWLMQRDWGRIMRASFALHTVVAALIYGLVAAASGGGLPSSLDVFARLRGWDVLGRKVTALMAERPGAAVLTDDRMLMAELLYYTRDDGYPIVIWSGDGKARNQYELTAAFDAATNPHVLYVTKWSEPDPILNRFAQVRTLPVLSVPGSRGRTRVFHFYDLDG
ncbi:MAG: ArnT family glycosyltransferase [Alphaproteobacteria bacterium]